MFKKLLRHFVIEIIALYLVNTWVNGLQFNDRLSGIIITGFALALAMMLIRPVIKILILPISLATLGLFRFLAHTVTLYIVDLALPEFSITGFHFPGLTSQYLDLPALNYAEGFMAFIAFSLLLSTVTHTINWITK